MTKTIILISVFLLSIAGCAKRPYDVRLDMIAREQAVQKIIIDNYSNFDKKALDKGSPLVII